MNLPIAKCFGHFFVVLIDNQCIGIVKLQVCVLPPKRESQFILLVCTLSNKLTFSENTLPCCFSFHVLEKQEK